MLSLFYFHHFLPNREAPKMSAPMNNTIKMKKIIFAIPAALAAMSVNPSTAAMMAMIKKIADHFSMM